MRPDKTKFKRDIDVVKENHKFLWEDGDGDEENPKSLSWEQRIAKKYWDKLFKEYAITDLTYYKSKFQNHEITQLSGFYRESYCISLAH